MASLIPGPNLGLEGAPHLDFQPAVDLSTGRLLGFEALLRWEAGGQAVPPGALIPWAEARGLMTAINAWILAEACSQAARWPSNLQLAVNCSVFQLRRREAAAAAAAALELSGLAPDRLAIEITETALIDDSAVADLQAMSRLGVQLTLDDVASDWSVLKNLGDCVVNTMKIDGTLVDELKVSGSPTQTVVQTIVRISRSLGICTVAEAVETAVQVAVLREAGVEVAQGFFFSPPVSAAEAYGLAATVPLPTYSLTVPGAAREPAGVTVPPPQPVPPAAAVGAPAGTRPPSRDAGRVRELSDAVAALTQAVERQSEILVSLVETSRHFVDV